MEGLVVDREFWAGKRVAVTGHTGFKGGWLTLWLASLGAEVSGFSAGAPSSPSLCELARVAELGPSARGDIRDLEAVERFLAAQAPEIVLHLAAQPIVRRGFTDPVGTFAANVMGTVHLLEAARRTDSVRVVVVVTSDKAYENVEWEWGYREGDPLGGRDPYSSSKACAELVTAAYRRSFFAAPPNGGPAVRVATARAGNVIGGGDWGVDRLIPDVMRAALEGRPVRVRNPDAIRPWQHVLNPLSGYLAIARSAWDSEADAEAWNFAPEDADARPVRWIVERVAGRWGEGLRWEADPGPHPPEAHYLKLDSSRARSRLGWRPRWPLDEALDSIVDWFHAYRAHEDMREVTLAQIERFAAPPSVGVTQRNEGT